VASARQPRVVIVGAGLGGIAAGVELRRHGFNDVSIHSWYRENGEGRIVANWPGYMREYQQAVEQLDPREFVFTPAPAREPSLEPR
jgi:monoamine oxidase